MIRRPARWAAAGLTVAAAALAVTAFLLFPPRPALEFAAQRFLGPQATWTRLDRSGTHPRLWTLYAPGRPVSVKIAEAELTHSCFRGLLSGVWEFRVKDVQIVPPGPKWPELKFQSGRGRWVQPLRRLELREWVSAGLRFEADLTWSPAGALEAARVAGDADVSELAKALSAWRALSSNEESSRRRTFVIAYSKGSVSIQVDEKPFFKASWRSDGAF